MATSQLELLGAPTERVVEVPEARLLVVVVVAALKAELSVAKVPPALCAVSKVVILTRYQNRRLLPYRDCNGARSLWIVVIDLV